MSRRLLLAIGIAALPAAALAAAPAPATSGAAADAVTGVWVTPGAKSRVHIYRGDDGKFYGKIIWLKQPDYPQNFADKALAGKPKVDRHNPDKRLRARSVVGLNVLRDFQYLPGHHAWGKGKCYDPESGKTYHCRMWLRDGGRELKLRGYVWIFHRTETWKRYEGAASAATAAHPPS